MSTSEHVPSSSPQRVPTLSELHEQIEKNRRDLDALEVTTADLADMERRTSRMEVSHILSLAFEMVVDKL
jgi:hypothetical protein